MRLVSNKEAKLNKILIYSVMKNSGTFGCLFLALILCALVAAKFCFYVVDEREQFLVTRFGEVQGEPVTTAGLHFKTPLDKPHSFPKQILEWDGRATEMPTKDKTYIKVDTYARWRIVDVVTYFQKLRTENSAISRLDDILDSETRNSIAKNNLIEVIRSTKDRKPAVDGDIAEADITGKIGTLPPIRRGRTELEKEIFQTSKEKLKEFGIELLDIRFKRINYNEKVRRRIYEQMISERQQIAERFRSEGAGEAAKILGSMEKDLAEIESAAYKASETIKGEADAKATEIYAEAYGRTDEAAEFYEFVRTMDLYEQMMSGDSTVVLSTDSDMFKYLKSVKPEAPAAAKPKPAAPAKRPAAARSNAELAR